MLSKVSFFLGAFIFTVGLFSTGCSQSVTPNDDDRSSNFSFTFRGERYECPTKNYRTNKIGMLVPDVNRNTTNYSVHTADDEPNSFSISCKFNDVFYLNIYITFKDKLQPGIYPIIDSDKMCKGGNECLKKGYASIIKNSNNTDKTHIIWISSTDGTLKIENIYIGKFNQMGIAKGRATGSFYFKGTNGVNNSGKVKGTFTNIKFIVTKD